MSRLLRLMLLAPDMVEAIFDGLQPADMQLDDLLKGFPLELEMQEPIRRGRVAPLLRAPGFAGSAAVAGRRG